MRPASEERRAVLVRIPPAIYDAIGQAAWREQRTINAEILWAIRCYLAARFPEQREQSASDSLSVG